MIVDTSVLLAYFDRDEPDYPRCSAVIDAATDELVVSPYVVAELDYLLMTRPGVRAEIAALGQLTGGAWELPAFSSAELSTATKVIARYADQGIGLADASMVVLADRHRTRTVATLDHRHFGVVRPLSGGRFTIVP